LSEVEKEYLDQVEAAQSLTASNSENFGEIFGRAWPLREQLISALLEAGVGTAFTGTLEALEEINPPDGYQAVHQSLVESTRELARLDAEAAQAVEDDDLARFVLINGQLGDVNGLFLINLPGGFCNALNPTGTPLRHLCAPVEQLPGGEYGAQLNQMLRQFQPRFESAGGVFGFPLSLLPEELARVFSVEAPIVEVLLQEIRDGVGSLTPTAELRLDHEVLIEYLEGVTITFREATEAAEAGDLQTARMAILGIGEEICETQRSFSSPDFNLLVSVHFGGGPDNCAEAPF
jgi:hypothetical protein